MNLQTTNFIFLIFFIFSLNLNAQVQQNFSYLSESTSKDTISIIGVGDIMLGTNFPSEKYLPKNPQILLSSVKNILKNANITFGNLEGTILSGEGELKHCKNAETCYAFKTPEYYVQFLKDAGFDFLSVANNHSYDFGDFGKYNTIKTLNEYNIKFAGYFDFPYAILTKDNLKFGFCAFAPNKGTVNISNYIQAERIVSKLDSICDIGRRTIFSCYQKR